jgi:hypothetical protein
MYCVTFIPPGTTVWGWYLLTEPNRCRRYPDISRYSRCIELQLVSPESEALPTEPTTFAWPYQFTHPPLIRASQTDRLLMHGAQHLLVTLNADIYAIV